MTNSFKFYYILKNEDAPPFIGEKAIFAADGLGGSGSNVHKIDREKFPDLREGLFASAFVDFGETDEKFSAYLDDLLAPMVDEISDTSALWASRIVIARCVYAMTHEFADADLGDGNIRQKLCDFISEGLSNTVDYFGLENGKLTGQLLLPTTLAFVRFAENEQSVTAEVVWAGDSRCYALTRDGLKLISVDDEDSTGAVSNLFYANNNKVHLNYLRHEIPKPCAFMAVSDGVFDPFSPHENLGVEFTFLSELKESNSFEELAQNLQSYYAAGHADDTTMAFATFGFEDFRALRDAFAPRTEFIRDLCARQGEMQSRLDVLGKSDEEVNHYILQRTSDKYEYVVQTLANAIKNGVNDIAITDEVKNIVRNVKSVADELADNEREKKIDERLQTLFDEINENPQKVATEKMTRSYCPVDDVALLPFYYSQLRRNSQALIEIGERLDVLNQKKQELLKKRNDLHIELTKKIVACREQFDDLWKSDDMQKRTDLEFVLHRWQEADVCLQFSQKIRSFPNTSEDDKLLLKKIRKNSFDMYSNVKKIAAQQEQYDDSLEQFREAWKFVFKYLRLHPGQIADFLGEETAAKLNIGSLLQRSEAKLNDDLVRKIVATLRLRQDVVTQSIVGAFAENFNKTSVLDAMYNASKLAQFRTYYMVKSAPVDELLMHGQQLAEVEENYISLVKTDD